MNVTGIEAEVCKDIAERQRKGVAKYGVTVADNPLSLKEWLQHAYEESLDLPIYLKRAIMAMENVLAHPLGGVVVNSNEVKEDSSHE